MKYLKDINPELLIFTLIIYSLYIISCCIFLNIIETGVELNMYEFNIKTISVISMILFGSGTYGLIKLLKNH